MAISGDWNLAIDTVGDLHLLPEETPEAVWSDPTVNLRTSPRIRNRCWDIETARVERQAIRRTVITWTSAKPISVLGK
jgi:hypothetical protein